MYSSHNSAIRINGNKYGDAVMVRDAQVLWYGTDWESETGCYGTDWIGSMRYFYAAEEWM